jgi:hypothetical protein
MTGAASTNTTTVMMQLYIIFQSNLQQALVRINSRQCFLFQSFLLKIKCDGIHSELKKLAAKVRQMNLVGVTKFQVSPLPVLRFFVPHHSVLFVNPN